VYRENANLRPGISENKLNFSTVVHIKEIFFYFCVQMSNNHYTPISYRNKDSFTNINIIHSNKAIIAVVGAYILRYKNEKGLSYEKIGLKAGCSDTMVFMLCKGRVNYCSLSVLSAVALACGTTLLDMLRPDNSNPFGATV